MNVETRKASQAQQPIDLTLSPFGLHRPKQVSRATITPSTCSHESNISAEVGKGKGAKGGVDGRGDGRGGARWDQQQTDLMTH